MGKDFIIHVLNNLTEEYDVVLDGLVNHSTSFGPVVLTIEVIYDKLTQWYNEIWTKKEKKAKKALAAYGKQFNDDCQKCGKFGHKLTDPKCLKNMNKK